MVAAGDSSGGSRRQRRQPAAGSRRGWGRGGRRQRRQSRLPLMLGGKGGQRRPGGGGPRRLFSDLTLLGVVAGVPPTAALLPLPPPRWAAAAAAAAVAQPRLTAIVAVQWANMAAKWGGVPDGGGDGSDGSGGVGDGGSAEPVPPPTPRAAAVVLRVCTSHAYVRMTAAALFDCPLGSWVLELVVTLEAAAPADELALQVARAVLDACAGAARGGGRTPAAPTDSGESGRGAPAGARRGLRGRLFVPHMYHQNTKQVA